MPNTNRLGKASKMYYLIADTDITAADATVLALAWVELCVKSVKPSLSREEIKFADRCTGSTVEYDVGDKEWSIDFELDERRVTNATRKAWDTAVNNGSIISLLILNDAKGEATACGIVGNFVITKQDWDQPEGNEPNKLSYSAKPAAASAFTPKIDNIYGASIP